MLICEAFGLLITTMWNPQRCFRQLPSELFMLDWSMTEPTHKEAAAHGEVLLWQKHAQAQSYLKLSNKGSLCNLHGGGLLKRLQNISSV